jgi:hypothetical protein
MAAGAKFGELSLNTFCCGSSSEAGGRVVSNVEAGLFSRRGSGGASRSGRRSGQSGDVQHPFAASVRARFHLVESAQPARADSNDKLTIKKRKGFLS